MKQQQLCSGLVLHYGGRALSLLSPEEGRVEKIWYTGRNQSPLHPGSFISYYADCSVTSSRTPLEKLDLEKSASHLGVQDIYLLHALLEVCYYFIPVGSEAKDAFYFLHELFEKFSFFPLPAQKRQVVCKLLALLAVYPDESAMYALVHDLTSMPIDNLIKGPIDLKSEKRMNIWLAWCQQVHPKGAFFKALPYLVEK